MKDPSSEGACKHKIKSFLAIILLQPLRIAIRCSGIYLQRMLLHFTKSNNPVPQLVGKKMLLEPGLH